MTQCRAPELFHTLFISLHFFIYSMSSPSSPLRALVTGGNQGIGYSIVKALLSHQPPFQVILACRDTNKGQSAIESLAKQGVNTSGASVVQLDLSDSNSISSCVSCLLSSVGSNSIDFLINNAGFAFKGSRFDEEVCRISSQINYFGTRNFTESCFPLLTSSCSIINISSVAGKRAMEMMSEQVKQRFLADSLTIQQLDELLEEFFQSVQSGTHKSSGWPESGYGVSKAALSMWTRILARQFNQQDKQLSINACCPGFVKTEMSSFNGILTPDQGAETPMEIVKAILQGKKINGTFWANKKQSNWVD